MDNNGTCGTQAMYAVSVELVTGGHPSGLGVDNNDRSGPDEARGADPDEHRVQAAALEAPGTIGSAQADVFRIRDRGRPGDVDGQLSGSGEHRDRGMTHHPRLPDDLKVEVAVQVPS